MADETPVVHRSGKNSAEEVPASLTTPGGRRDLDLRVSFEAEVGSWPPAKQGIIGSAR